MLLRLYAGITFINHFFNRNQTNSKRVIKLQINKNSFTFAHLIFLIKTKYTT